MPKLAIWRIFEKLKISVKQCYQTGQFQYDKNWWKMTKCQKLKCDIWVIFKQCVHTSSSTKRSNDQSKESQIEWDTTSKIWHRIRFIHRVQLVCNQNQKDQTWNNEKTASCNRTLSSVVMYWHFFNSIYLWLNELWKFFFDDRWLYYCYQSFWVEYQQKWWYREHILRKCIKLSIGVQ